jgi:hypothetical protein
MAKTRREGWGVAGGRISRSGSDRYVTVHKCWRGGYDKPWHPRQLVRGPDPTRKRTRRGGSAAGGFFCRTACVHCGDSELARSQSRGGWSSYDSQFQEVRATPMIGV